jgi:hypothetical protein
MDAGVSNGAREHNSVERKVLNRIVNTDQTAVVWEVSIVNPLTNATFVLFSRTEKF